MDKHVDDGAHGGSSKTPASTLSPSPFPSQPTSIMSSLMPSLTSQPSAMRSQSSPIPTPTSTLPSQSSRMPSQLSVMEYVKDKVGLGASKTTLSNKLSPSEPVSNIDNTKNKGRSAAASEEKKGSGSASSGHSTCQSSGMASEKKCRRWTAREKCLLASVFVLAVALLVVTVIIIIKAGSFKLSVVIVMEKTNDKDDTKDAQETTDKGGAKQEMAAVCVMHADPKSSQSVAGTVHFHQVAGLPLEVSVDIKGLDDVADGSPDDDFMHGLHVHQYGDRQEGCSSMGGHYNPRGVHHGGPTDSVRHPGDFGNLNQTSDGEIHTTFTDPWASLFGSESILGRGLVLHAHKDDYGKGGNDGSLAHGNAGARLACCVISCTDLNLWKDLTDAG